MEIKLDKNRKAKVTTSADIYPIMREILLRENKIGRAQEHFWMIGLNQSNKILYIELVALGSSNMAAIKPREAFRLAIHKLAVRVIIVHNHPSADVEPSEVDKDFTDHFIQAGKFLNIQVLDHLIISEKAYYSFVDSGVFAKLQESKKWVLPFELEENAKKEKAIEIAELMLIKGMGVEEVVSLTGLSKETVQALKRAENEKST
jgi:DNA repair protein RadC